jgi:hypothetical protein
MADGEDALAPVEAQPEIRVKRAQRYGSLRSANWTDSYGGELAFSY